MVLTNLAQVEGPNLALHLIRPDDADYEHSLRTDPAYNLCLSEARGGADDQRRWIEGYRARDAVLCELYCEIERKDGTRCGMVRLYDILTDSFTWGSWILDHNKMWKAALESAVLSFGPGFEELGLSRAHTDVRIGNTHADEFYRRLGMTEIRRDDRDIFFTYPHRQSEVDHTGYLAILEEECAK